ncbi:WS/DGAT domain-containing protein, partial [Mycolicibacterium pulveris]
WEATLVDGLSDGGAAVLVKFNHALTDGVGAVEMARILYNPDEFTDGAARGPKAPEPTGRSRLDALRDVVEYQTGLIGAAMTTPLKAAPAVVRAISRPVDAVAGGWSTATSILRTARPVTKPRSPIMVDRSLVRHVYVHEVPKSALRQAGHRAGGSLNDAFVAAVAGGLRAYHVKHNAPVDELILSMPINLRTEADPIGGNRATLIRFDIPVGIADPVERIRVVRDRTDKARNEESLAHTEFIAGALNLMPRSYVGSALRNVDLIASNVPGFPAPVAFAGAPVRVQYAFSPTLGAALNVTLLSHVDTCALGINIDGAAVPDHDVLFDCLTEGFDEVLTLAR